MRSGRRETGLSTPEARAKKAKFLALAALAAFLLVGCGAEEAKPTEEAEEATEAEPAEPAESVPEATPANREEPEATATNREASEPVGIQEAPVVPEPKMTFVEEVATPVESAPTAPPPAPAGVSTAQTASPDPATVGLPLTFTVTVHNGSATQRAALKNFLPSGVSFVSATPSQGSCGAGHHGGGTVECVLGEIPSGSSVTVSLVVTPTVPGTLTNTAVALAEFSPAAPTNSASTTVTANPAVPGPSAAGNPEAHSSKSHEAH